MNGYSRTWAALGGSDVASTVPKRLGADRLHKFGLWANYAMDRRENTLLEDWYRFAHGADRRYGRRLGPNLNGYLYGRPEFVADSNHRGFRFDGRTQYGELCPRLADLGEITVLVIVKWEGRGSQTIFDFGSSPDNCFVLGTGQSGKPELAARVDGKTVVELTATTALLPEAWVSLRVEMDGRRVALWLDGSRVAEKPSSFRPCDACPGGQRKRNFPAVSRGGSGHFKGVIDRVVVYHTVHEDFGKVPEPTRDAPTRPSAEVVMSFEKEHGDVAETNRKIQAGVEKMLRPYERLKEQQEARIRELQEQDPAFLAAEQELEVVKGGAERRKREMGMEFDKLPETAEVKAQIEELRKQSGELHSRLRKIESERLSRDQELAAVQAQRKEAEEQLRALEGKLRAEFEKQPEVVDGRTTLAERRKQLDEVRPEVERLEKEAREKDDQLTALYARRKEIEEKRRAAEESVKERFKTAAEVVEIDKKIAAAQERRNAKELDQTARDAAAREENELRRKKDQEWRNLRDGDSEYGRRSSLLDNANRKIRDRENALRAEVRQKSPSGRRQKDLEKETRQRDRTLHNLYQEFRNSNEDRATLDGRVRDLGTKYRERENALRDELRRSHPTVRRLDGEKRDVDQALRAKDRALREKRDLYVSKRTPDMALKVGAAEKALKEATEKALAPYIPEKPWIRGFGYQAFRGYYNTSYGAYIRDHVRAQVGGDEMREEVNFLAELQKAAAGDEGWSTRVDWDWRMKQEVDGTIKDLPLLERWIQRARGPVMFGDQKSAARNQWSTSE